ncbi:unnamed protein product [Arctogadus glacialis]
MPSVFKFTVFIFIFPAAAMRRTSDTGSQQETGVGVRAVEPPAARHSGRPAGRGSDQRLRGGDHNTARGQSAAERRQADNRDTEIRQGEVDTASTQGGLLPVGRCGHANAH